MSFLPNKYIQRSSRVLFGTDDVISHGAQLVNRRVQPTIPHTIRNGAYILDMSYSISSIRRAVQFLRYFSLSCKLENKKNIVNRAVWFIVEDYEMYVALEKFLTKITKKSKKVHKRVLILPGWVPGLLSNRSFIGRSGLPYAVVLLGDPQVWDSRLTGARREFERAKIPSIYMSHNPEFNQVGFPVHVGPRSPGFLASLGKVFIRACL